MKKRIKKRLIEIAKEKGTITYGELAKEFEVYVVQLFNPLDKINDESIKDDSILFSVVVVNMKTRLPGKGFFSKVAVGKWGDEKREELKASGNKEFFKQECDLVYRLYNN